MIDTYESLSNAIVMHAVRDYRAARHKLKKNHKKAEARAMMEDCESFFLSDWFETLTNVHGKIILKKLQQEDDK